MVEASAPGRVNLIGEHTDYNGGRCLPFAIDLRTSVTLRPRPSRRITVRSVQAGEAVTAELDQLTPGIRGGWAAYPLGVVWALQQEGWAVPGMEVCIDSDVPLGAGLSSSAALECAVATAVAALLDRPLDRDARRHLAAACVRAEFEFVGAPTGGMDQSVAMLGEPDRAVLLDFADNTAHAVPLPLTDAGLTVLVIDTGSPHALADGGGYADRRTECAAAAAALGVESLRSATEDDLDRIDDPTLRARARHVVTEERRVDAALAAIATGDWATLGQVLTDAHRSLRDDFAVSTSALDLAVDTAVDAGALGARLVGGGFGGSAIALVAYVVHAAFGAADHPRPICYEVRPAAGADVTSARNSTAPARGGPR